MSSLQQVALSSLLVPMALLHRYISLELGYPIVSSQSCKDQEYYQVDSKTNQNFLPTVVAEKVSPPKSTAEVSYSARRPASPYLSSIGILWITGK